MNSIKKLIDTENAIVLLFTLAGAYAFLEANQFSSDAATFPRLTSGVVIVLGVLLLFRDLYPESVRSALFKESSLGQNIDDDLDLPDAEENGKQEDTTDSAVQDGPPDWKQTIRNDRIILSVLAFIYLVLSYTISLLYATPIFVAVYLFTERKPWYIILVMTIISFLIVYGFWWGIDLPVEQGVLL